METQIDKIADALATEMDTFAGLLVACVGVDSSIVAAFYQAWQNVEVTVYAESE